MRIVSKFRDYYDSVQGHGMDLNLVYRRESTEFEVQDHLFEWTELRRLLLEAPLHQNQIELLCFCGRVYVFARILYFVPRETFHESGPFTSGSALRDGLVEMHRRFPDEHWFERRIESLDHVYKGKTGAEEFDQYVQQNAGREVQESIFRKFGAPALRIRSEGIFSHTSFSVLTNPILKSYRFEQHFDPFTCFQEIAMYLGNQLAQPDVAPQSVGSDKDLAKAKGFDDQSFRTAAPGQKKLNRKANKERKRRKD